MIEEQKWSSCLLPIKNGNSCFLIAASLSELLDWTYFREHAVIQTSNLGFLFIDSFIDVNTLEAVEQGAVVAVMELALVVKVGVAKMTHAFLLLFLLDVNAVDIAVLGEQVAWNRDHLVFLRTELNKEGSTLPAFLTFLLF